MDGWKPSKYIWCWFAFLYRRKCIVWPRKWRKSLVWYFSANQSFDITKLQTTAVCYPYICYLVLVLEEFIIKWRCVRGLSGINKLIDSNALGTIELSTGLQISGVFSSVIEHEGKPIYIQTTGKNALAYREKRISRSWNIDMLLAF
jgi:hypothetical protein